VLGTGSTTGTSRSQRTFWRCPDPLDDCMGVGVLVMIHRVRAHCRVFCALLHYYIFMLRILLVPMIVAAVYDGAM